MHEHANAKRTLILSDKVAEFAVCYSSYALFGFPLLYADILRTYANFVSLLSERHHEYDSFWCSVWQCQEPAR
jgi:hypothetical protein